LNGRGDFNSLIIAATEVEKYADIKNRPNNQSPSG